MERGDSLETIAGLVGQPDALITNEGQILTLRPARPKRSILSALWGVGNMTRILVYRIETTDLLWMILIPDDEARHIYSAFDNILMSFDQLAQTLQRSLE